MATFNVQFQSTENSFGADFGTVIFINDYDTYEGTYEVTPQANDSVVLKTKNTILHDDVTVDKVPCRETHNQYGTTLYIASEV